MPTEYRRGRGPHFAPIPFELMDDPEADALTIATYAAVKSYADFGSCDGAAVSDRTACQRAGMSERAFRDRREKLRQMGWLEWDTEATPSGRVNRYVVHASAPPKPEEGVRQDVPDPSGTTRRTGPAPRADDREPRTESHIPNTPPSPPTGGVSDGFERFRAAYPKRPGGQRWRAAQKAWNARRKDGFDEDAMVAAAERYAAFVVATGRQNTEYVKQAATFLGDPECLESSWTPPPPMPNGNGRRTVGQGPKTPEEERAYYRQQREEAARRAKVEMPEDIEEWKTANPARAQEIYRAVAFGTEAIELAKTEESYKVQAFIDRTVISRIRQEMVAP